MEPRRNSRPSGRKILMNHILDRIAKETPDRVYAELPVSADTFDNGFRKVTFGDLSHAVNGMAWFLERALGKGKNFETLVYFGPNDIGHVIVLLASVKAGYKALFPSPKYSAMEFANLIKSANGHALLVPDPRPAAADTVLEALDLQILQIPDSFELMKTQHPHYEFKRTFGESQSEPLVVLHTSGTTGFPKPIIWTHGWADSYAAQRYASLHPPEGSDTPETLMLGARTMCLSPAFHASGLFVTLLFAIYCGTTVIMPLPNVPAHAQMIVDASQQTQIDCVVAIPPYVEQLGADEDLLKRANIKGIMWGGGDISVTTGEKISPSIQIFTVAGSTEMGMWARTRPGGGWNRDLWHWMRFHPLENVEFVERSKGVYEAVIHRNKPTDDADYVQPIFHIFPEMEIYETGDLFLAHPTEPDLWRHFGRADDMQIFASGEKYYPAVVEKHIAQHPDVQVALFVGSRRKQAALILELQSGISMETQEDLSAALERIWPEIEDANETMPVYAKIAKDHVILIDGNQSLPRTAKGTVQKQAVITLYQKELDALGVPKDDIISNGNGNGN